MRDLSLLIHSFIPLLIHHLYMSVWSHGSLLHTLHYNPTRCCSFGSHVLALDVGSSFRSTPLPIWHALISLFFEQFLLPVSTRCYRLLCMLLGPAQESAISPGVLECSDWRIVSERKVWVLTDTESRIFEKCKMRRLPFPWNKVCTHCRSYLALGHLFSLVLSHRAAVMSPFLLIRQTLDSLWSSLVFAWWTPGPREMPLDSRRYLPCSPWSSSLSKASGTWQGWTARWGESDDL